MSHELDNEFRNYVVDTPAWATGVNCKSAVYASLIGMLKTIGTDRAVIMTTEEFKRLFPASGAVSYIKAYGLKNGLRVKLVHHDSKIAITATRLTLPVQESVYKKRKDGTLKVK